MRKQNKKNRSEIFALILLVIFLCLLIFILIANSKSKQNSKEKLADWKRYSGYGLSFSYPPNWRIEQSDAELGDEIGWSFDFEENNNRTDAMDIKLVKDYIPLPDISDPLRSYFYESDIRNRSEILKEEQFKNRRALRYTVNSNGKVWDSETFLIELPEISGVLYLYFPDSFENLNLPQAVEKYFLPFLQSLQINPSPQLWPSIKPLLTSDPIIDRSSWKKYEGENFLFRYPNTWQIEEKNDPDFANLLNIIVTKSTAETINDRKVPQIIIGTPNVFSTSGALCANQTYGQCLDIGQVAVKIKEKTYWGTIFDKYEFYHSFYVFQVAPNRLPSQPAITAIFKDLVQGQEIVNILSTIEY